jgi:hypothetical protein
MFQLTLVDRSDVHGRELDRKKVGPVIGKRTIATNDFCLPDLAVERSMLPVTVDQFPKL